MSHLGSASHGDAKILKNNSVAAVIPLFNHQRYVAEAIQSLLSQTRPVERVIIVDDGSTDGSMDVVRGFSDPRVSVVSQPNSGAHAAINHGVEIAGDCEYVAILNSDDIYQPSRVEKCVGFLQQNPNLEMVFTGLELINEEGRKLESAEPRAKWFDAARSLGADETPLIEWLGKANVAVTTSNFFARRAYLLRNPLRPYRYVHDYHALVSCALEGRLGRLEESLLCYRAHAGNTIAVRPLVLGREMLRMNFDLLREAAPRLAENAELRAAVAAYQRAAWDSISSFHAGVFASCAAFVLARAAPDLIEDALRIAERMPEMEETANRSLLTGREPGVTVVSALADNMRLCGKSKWRGGSMLLCWRVFRSLDGWPCSERLAVARSSPAAEGRRCLRGARF